MTWATERCLAVDLEATSALPDEAIPVSFALVEFNEGAVTRVRHGLCDPGIPIPPESMAIHQITDDMVRERGGTLEATISGIARTLEKAVSARCPLVIYNASYDLSVLQANYQRLFGVPMIGEKWEGMVIDPLVIDRHVDRYRRGSRKLTATAEHYGVKLTEAHTAAADATAAALVAFAQAAKYPEVANADPELLTHLQRGWHQEWFEQFSAYLVGQGKDPLPSGENQWPVRGLLDAKAR
jgi:DNA polymerase III subunit epsilon